jgi:hypothetical protein
VRQIDALLDPSWMHKKLAPYDSHAGWPSIDPVLVIRMLLFGDVFAIRSEQQIQTAHHSLCLMPAFGSTTDAVLIISRKREVVRVADFTIRPTYSR